MSTAPTTGNRIQSSVVILEVNSGGSYVIDPQWAVAAGFPLPATGG